MKPVLRRLSSVETRNLLTSAQGWCTPLFLRWKIDKRLGVQPMGGQRAVCCMADLAKLGVSSEGEIIHHPSTENPGWPKVFGVSFDLDEVVAKLPSKSIQVTKTGMYYSSVKLLLSEVICSPKPHPDPPFPPFPPHSPCLLHNTSSLHHSSRITLSHFLHINPIGNYNLSLQPPIGLPLSTQHHSSHSSQSPITNPSSPSSLL